MTNRSTWPSSDLWKRLATGALADDAACPACGCPAATHQRDVVAGAYFCPIQVDGPSDYALPEVEAQRTKLWQMLKRAPLVPNAMVAAAPVFMEAMRKRAAKELAMISRQNPDFDDLRPILSRIVAQEPTIDLLAALERARALMAEQKFMRGEEKRRAPAMQEWMKLMQEAEQRAAAGQRMADKRSAAKPSKPPATVGTGKRKYNFDEDL